MADYENITFYASLSSHHRRGNIIKDCGGGGGKIKYSALWMYNKLLGCRTSEQIQAATDSFFPFS